MSISKLGQTGHRYRPGQSVCEQRVKGRSLLCCRKSQNKQWEGTSRGNLSLSSPHPQFRDRALPSFKHSDIPGGILQCPLSLWPRTAKERAVLVWHSHTEVIPTIPISTCACSPCGWRLWASDPKVITAHASALPCRPVSVHMHWPCLLEGLTGS